MNSWIFNQKQISDEAKPPLRDRIAQGGIIIQPKTKLALENAYIALQEIVINLYAEADIAVAESNYNDASLLQAQADRLYETAENIGIVIAEQEE